MTKSSPKEITQLLLAWSHGEQAALDQLIPLVHDELHRIAKRYMRRERPGQTMQTTALVDEAYLRLVDANVGWQNRVHFFAIAARLLRRILVDYAKASNSRKRGGGIERKRWLLDHERTLRLPL